MHTPTNSVSAGKSPADVQRVQSRAFQNRKVRTVHETSAGGVAVRIIDGTAYVAVIIRRGRGGQKELCLPKGHLESNETAPVAAAREIAEETGITTRILLHLGSVDYWFSGSTARIHKRVHHFLAEYLSGDITAENDPDQEAEDAVWLELREATMSLSYANERRIVQTAVDLLYSTQNTNGDKS